MATETGRWAAATAFVAEQDAAMAEVVERVGPCTLVRRRHPGGYFAALARAVVYQQLAGRAAAAIHARFVAIFDGRPRAEAVLSAPDEELRGAGLSAAKVATIKDLAAKVVDGSMRLGGLGRLPDDEIVRRLCEVRGIGRWTAEMFLVFQLNRPDVWPVGDFGVRSGFARVHGLRELPSPAELGVLGERFRPYRTVAAWYCWRAMDPPRPTLSTRPRPKW